MNQIKLIQLIRKMYMPRLIIPIVLFLTLVAFMIINPFNSHLKPVTVDNISKISNLYQQGKDDIVYTAKELHYSGIDCSVNNKVKASVYYLLEDNRCYFFLICVDNPKAIPQTLENYTVKAHLTSNNNMYESVIASMSEKLEFSADNLSAMSSMIIVDEYDYTHNITAYAIVALRIFGVMLIIDIIFISFVFFNPHISIPFFKMRKYGKLKALYTQAAQEFNDSAIQYGKKIYISDNFLFGINSKHNVEIAYLENIVWIYKEKELIITNGNAEVLSSLCMVTDQKKIIRIHRVSDEILNVIIPLLLKMHPEIMYSGEN